MTMVQGPNSIIRPHPKPRENETTSECNGHIEGEPGHENIYFCPKCQYSLLVNDVQVFAASWEKFYEKFTNSTKEG